MVGVHAHIPKSCNSKRITSDIINNFVVATDNCCPIMNVITPKQRFGETYFRIFAKRLYFLVDFEAG